MNNSLGVVKRLDTEDPLIKIMFEEKEIQKLKQQ